VSDAEERPLLRSAVARDDPAEYLKLLAAATAVGLLLLGRVTMLLVAAVVVGLGLYGQWADDPIVWVAVTLASAPPRLTSEMIVTALNSLGVPVLGAKGGERSGSPHQSVDIGTGWVASVDLPAGATPERITGRPRSRPGSGGRSVRLARHRP